MMAGLWPKYFGVNIIIIIIIYVCVYICIYAPLLSPTRHVACMGERIVVYRVLVVKLEGKRQLGRPRRRWEDKIRWIFRKWDVGVWTGLSWLRIGTGSRHL
jgi:MFS-type transporter involved in bile tolerance (Atg22 family)